MKTACGVLVAMWLLLERLVVQASDKSESLDAVKLHLRLVKDESYYVDLVQYSTFIRQVSVWEQNLTSNHIRHWYHQDYFVYSVKPEDCIEKGVLSPHLAVQPMLPRKFYEDEMWIKYSPYNLTTRQVLSRRIKFSLNQLFMTNTYFQAFNDLTRPTGFVNLMETKSVKYNQSAIDIRQIKDERGTNSSNFWINGSEYRTEVGVPEVFKVPVMTCITGYYILAYQETVFVCASVTKLNETHIYFYRSQQKKSYFMASLSAEYRLAYVFEQPVSADFNVLIEPTPDDSFELVLYFYKKNDVFLLTFNAVDVFNIQSYKLLNKISDVKYIKKTLMLFFSDMENTYKTYYLHRIPGSRFLPEKLLIFADARPLGSLYSNENVEIILEMYKQFHSQPKNEKQMKEELKGLVPPITHLLYSYNLITKSLVQISTQIFTVTLKDIYYGLTFRVDSFSHLDMVVLMSHILIREVQTNQNVNRTSIQLYMDAYSGFGSTSIKNESYELYSLDTFYDPWTEHYFLFPHSTQNIATHGLNKTCDILRQRVVRPFVNIAFNDTKLFENITYIVTENITLKNNTTVSENKTLYMTSDNKLNFILAMNDTKLGATVYVLNFTYDKNSSRDSITVLKTIDNPIWIGSNLTEFQVNPNFERRSIELDLLVRGNFIVRNHSDPAFRDRPHFPYYAATIDEANKMMESSMFISDNLRIRNQNDIYLNDIQSILAFGVTSNNHNLDERILLIKTKKEVNLTVYKSLNRSRNLIPVKGPQVPSTIKKVIPVMENVYIIFDENGALSLFYAQNITFVPLSFPGVGCLDIELLAHNGIKPALLCYNINFEFTIYYVDQLIAKSLSYSFQKVNMKTDKSDGYRDPILSKLNGDSQILISEFYSSKVFMYLPNLKRDNLMVFYLDVEEFPSMNYIKTLTVINNVTEKKGLASKIQSLEFVEDRLVVHHKSADTVNYIEVYKLNDTLDLMRTKIVELPAEYTVKHNNKMQFFHKHFQSSIYANKNKPYLLLQIQLTSGSKDCSNVLVIDPFAPTLETFPTFLLPKHAEMCGTCQILMFEYFIASMDRIRFHSVGLLQYSKNSFNMFRDDSKFYYIFQLIDADSPKVYFSLERQNVVTYKNVFKPVNGTKVNTIPFGFHYDLINKYHLNLSLTISQKKTSDNNVAQQHDNKTSNETIRLEDVHKRVVGSKRDSKIIIYSMKFSELPNFSNSSNSTNAPNLNKDSKYTQIPNITDYSVFDWQLEAESVFDNNVGTFQFPKPLSKIKTLRGLKVDSIVNIDTFCRAYKMRQGRLICIKKGWIFIHQEDIEIFYKDNLADIQEGESIRFPFNVNECTESVVANHSLISVCTYNNERSIILTNLIDLSQKYSPIPGLNIFAKYSSPRIVKVYENAFVQFSKSIVDERNIKGVANSYYFMYEMSLAHQSLEWSTHINHDMRYIYGVDSKLTDTALGVGRLRNYSYEESFNDAQKRKEIEAYKLSGMNINTGNLVYVQIFEESYHIGPIQKATRDNKNMTDFDRTSTSKYKIGVLKINASTDVRRIVLNKASLINVVFNASDAIAQNNTDGHYYRYSLIHFPSYHSYLYRYQNTTHLSNTSFYKLENPFSEIENKHWDNKPVCYQWACLIVSTFDGNQNFVRVYDMRYENMSAPGFPPNFNILYPNQHFINEQNDPSHSSEKDSLNLDEIHDNYTIRPIQVLNTSNLRLIRFDESSNSTEKKEVLSVIMFFTSNKIEIFNLSRVARLTVNNLYFMSRYLELSVHSNHTKILKYRFNIMPFYEDDFYKYILQVAIIGGFSVTMVFFFYKFLRIEQERIQKEDEKDAAIELESKKNLLEEVRKMVFEIDEKPELKKSLARRASKTIDLKSMGPRFSKVMMQDIQDLNDENFSDDEVKLRNDPQA